MSAITLTPDVKPASYINWEAPIFSKLKMVSFKDHFQKNLENEYPCWERFKDFFKCKSPLRRDIESLAANANIENECEKNLQNIVKAFSSIDYHCLKPTLREILKKLTQEQTGKLFEKLVNQGIEKNNLEALHNCLKLVSSKELEEMMNEAIEKIGISPDETIQNMALAANVYKKVTANSSISTLQQHGRSLMSVFHRLMDTLLMAMSFLDMGKEISSNWDAVHLLEIYGKLIGAPLVIFAALAAIVTPLTAIILTAAIVVTISSLLYAYIQWIKPCPEHIDLCKNLTLAAMKGELAPVYGRKKEVDEIFRCLATSTPTNRVHPMLVGKTGAGKTELMNEVARRVVNGEVPEELKHIKYVFLINTVELEEKSVAMETQDKVQRLLNRLGRHRHESIIFFDEVHKAMPNLSDRLKPVFGTGVDSLPYVTAATTEEEFQKYIVGEEAFSRRFQRIDVHPTTEKETLFILRETANREAPDIGISEASLKKIAKLTTTEEMQKIKSQPAIGKRILNNAFAKMRERQAGRFPQLQEKVQRLANLSSALHAEPEAPDAPKKIAKISKLKNEIKDLKLVETEMQKKFLALSKLKKYRAEQRKALFELADRIEQNSKDIAKDKEQSKKLFIFLNYYLIPFLRNKIEVMEKTDLDDPNAEPIPEIDEKMIQELVDKVITDSKNKKIETPKPIPVYFCLPPKKKRKPQKA